jgi:Zn ribbon nucleic-acid-binding protein
MEKLSKLIVIGVFALFTFGLLINQTFSEFGTKVSAQTTPTPTPAAERPKPAETPAASNKTITKEFTLGKDSLSEYGEVPFNHDTHAFQKYSPDGKSVVGCVECHHTDQPKSALKPPLLTSERDAVLTMDVFQKSAQKVSECRACHFQDGSVPDDKEMPTAVYKEGDKEITKDLNNELAYHINCNTCHDAAAALRPELKKKAGFATTKDCLICHKEN